MDSQFKLPRSLNRFDAIMMLMGNMIGIGIFTTTGYIADYIQIPLYLFLIWILGAVYAICGALIYAELATQFPISGGDYHFLKSAYHPLLGFLFGWSTFTVTYTGSIATIAVGFATYFLNVMPMGMQHWNLPIGLNIEINSLELTAILITIFLTWINALGIKQGARLQNIFTVVGVAIILGFVLLGFCSANANPKNFDPFLPHQLNINEITILGVALVSVVFTYSGWTTIVYIAGEIKDPNRNIPAAMGTSVLVVATIYLLVNGVYLLSMPLGEMKGIIDIGYRSMQALFGGNVGIVFSILIMLLTLSSLNSTILSGARIYYAMAKEGRFFKIASKLHPKFKVPGMSLWLQCLWSIVLILSGTFHQLLTYTVFIMVVFSFLSGGALFLLRRRNNNLSKTAYRIKAYPILLSFYMIVSAWIMITVLINRPMESTIGLIIVGLGVPFYYYWKRKSA